MNLDFDLDCQRLVRRKGCSAPCMKLLRFKLRDTMEIELRFLENGRVVPIPGTDITFAIKDQLGGTLLARADSWVRGAANIYRAELSLNTTEAITAVGDEVEIPALAELTVAMGSGYVSSQLIPAKIEADLITGAEGTPDELPNPDDYQRIPGQGFGPPNAQPVGTATTDPVTAGTWVTVGLSSTDRPIYESPDGELTARHSDGIPEMAGNDGWEIRTSADELMWAVVSGGGETSLTLPLTGWLSLLDGAPDPTSEPEFELTGTVEATVGQEYQDRATGEFYRATDDDPMTWALLPQVDPDTGAIVGPVVLTPLTAASAASYVPPAGGIISTQGESLTAAGVVHELPGFAQLGDGIRPGLVLPIVGPRPVKYLFCDNDNPDPGTYTNRLVIDPRFDYVITYYGTAGAIIGFSGTPRIGQRFTILRASSGTVETSQSDSHPSMFIDAGPITNPVYGFVGHDVVDAAASTGILGSSGALEFEVIPAAAGFACRPGQNRSTNPLMLLVRYQRLVTWEEP